MNSQNFYNNFDIDSVSKNSFRCVPILCWDFQHEYIKEVRMFLSNLKTIQHIASQFKWDEASLNISERLKKEVVLITNLEQKIVFASEGIFKMTGYTQTEVLGNSPKMFQGAETSVSTLSEIRSAIEKRHSFKKTILNYKKNGETYDCIIDGFPVFNLKGDLSHFIAFEKTA